MATPAQAAAATVGAGSLAAAGAYGITQAVSGSEEETNTEEQTETDEQDLNEPTQVVTFENETTFTNYTGKLITFIKEANLAHLVKPLDPSNQKWWDWAFTNKYSKLKEGKQSHSIFQSVTSSETLKTACDSAYKAGKTDYSFEANHHLLQNISDYCTKTKSSVDISEPKFVVYTAKPNGYDNGLLSVESNWDKLIKSKIESGETNTNNNDLWWEWSFKNVFSKETGAKTDDFKNVNKGYSSSDDAESNKFLNNACDAAYKKNHSNLKTTGTTTPNLLTDIKKFCSTNREETELKLPEPVVSDENLIKKSTESYNDNKIVKKNESKLVDPTKETDWWNWMYENVYLVAKAAKTPALKAPFDKSTITQGYAEANSGDPINSLNKACKDAYSKSNGDLGKIATDGSLIKLIEKFCVPSYKAPLVDAEE